VHVSCCCCHQESPSTFYLYLLPGQLVASASPHQQQHQQQQPHQQQQLQGPVGAGQGEPQLSPSNPIAAMGGLAAFRAQLAAHLATYAASGGAAPGGVLAARRPGARGNCHLVAELEGAVIWYPVRQASFLQTRQLSFHACVLHGQQQQFTNRAPAQLHVIVPAVQPADGGAGAETGSVQVGTPMPGRLQLPGLWQEVSCLEVTVGTRSPEPHLYRSGGWGQLQHLQDHYMLGLSAVSGSLAALAHNPPVHSLCALYGCGVCIVGISSGLPNAGSA
jgi:hypothetical protein